MKKKDLCARAGISSASVTKMGEKRPRYNRNSAENLYGAELILVLKDLLLHYIRSPIFKKGPNTVFLQIPKEFFSVEAETQELKYSVLPLRGKSVIQAFDVLLQIPVTADIAAKNRIDEPFRYE